MLPLGAQTLPTNQDELVSALTAGFARVFHLPPRPIVQAVAADYPILSSLHVDVSGAALRDDFRPAPAHGPRQFALRVAELAIVGKPIRLDSTPLSFELTAREVHFDFTRDTFGRALLDPSDADAGHFRAEIAREALEPLVSSILKRAAADYEADIEKTELTLAAEDDRTVTIAARVTVSKKVFLTVARAVIRCRGRLRIDNDLNAHISQLHCEGEGMIGTMVVGLMQHEIKKWEGKKIPLATFSMGSLRLHDVKIRTETGLNIEAVFGI